MGVLQDEFNRVLSDHLSKPNLIKAVLRRALKHRSPGLTDEQLEKGAAALSAAIDEAKEGKTNVSLQLEAAGPDQSVELTDDDLSNALKEMEDDFSSGITDVVTRSVEEMSPGVLSKLYADAPKALRYRRKQQRRFEKNLYGRWQQGIDRLEMLVMIAQEAGETFLADVQRAHQDADAENTREELFLLDALVRIHVRSCRIACEILCLLKGGFADGANARWRTLHENAVVAMFIAQHGGEVAERYLAHSAVERYRAARQYQEHCEALGQEPLSAPELDELTQKYETAIAKYGADFRGDYGWAAQALGTRPSNFAEIESNLDMSRWRPYYKMACHSVHAGPQGLYFSLSVLEPTEMLVAGASNAGLCDPGHSAAVSLTMVSAATFTAKSNIDGLVTLRVMMELCDDIGNAFLDAHEQLAKDVALERKVTAQDAQDEVQR